MNKKFMVETILPIVAFIATLFLFVFVPLAQSMGWF